MALAKLVDLLAAVAEIIHLDLNKAKPLIFVSLVHRACFIPNLVQGWVFSSLIRYSAVL